MRFLATSLLALALGTMPVQAQDEAVPTQQTVAMELFGLANSALESGDHEAARRFLEAALDLKPAHPAILRGLMITAIRAERADDAFLALERMAAAGISFDPAPARELLEAADATRFAAIVAALESNQDPVGEAEVVARLNGIDDLIEGVAMDIETDRIFLSSVTGREILLLEPFARDEPQVFADREDGLWSVFSLAVDDRSRLVWAGSAAIDQTPMEEGEEGGTALFAFDLVSGELYRRYEIEGAVQIADFTVRDGVVYASDSQAPRVYVLNSLSGQLEVLAEDPRFISLQGVALARGAVIVADYATGLWRIDLGDGGVSLIRAGEESLIGIDGLRQTRDGRLLAVRNGTRPHQVMAIDLDETGHAVRETEVLLRSHPELGGEWGEPTLVDPADGRAWLLSNAAWPWFSADAADRPASGPPAATVLEMDLP
ncbi:tetratricopeptide repeat protein [Maricaulis parjimensis]|uniref:tetratricopeptide repeat protein n=1 Tax=Maricaulis parjimensis TaxID=144023 RepID=UPI0019395208|nr:tetratricopeptide repeat protein [Maricaulis parjimensis]